MENFIFSINLTTIYSIAIFVFMNLLIFPVNKKWFIFAGGHINPALSTAMLITRRISPIRAVMFIAAQCGGAVGGAAIIYRYIYLDIILLDQNCLSRIILSTCVKCLTSKLLKKHIHIDGLYRKHT